MPIYDAQPIPEKVSSSTKDPEIAEWLKTGPVLGAHKPIHIQRREHDAFIDEVKPPIGQIEHLGLRGPHGTIPVRVYHPSKPGPAQGSAMIYLHGGGFIVGSLDQFETAMRLLAEGSGTQVYCVDYKLAATASSNPGRRVRCSLAVGTCGRAWCRSCSAAFLSACATFSKPVAVALGSLISSGRQWTGGFVSRPACLMGPHVKKQSKDGDVARDRATL